MSFSTIDPNIPVAGTPAHSGAPLRANFAAAINDIDNLKAIIPADDTGTPIALGIPGRWNITQGSFTNPIRVPYPTLRMDKFEAIPLSLQPNPVDNAYNALIVLEAQGNADTQVQACGLWSWVRGGGTVAGADATGVIGVADVIWDQPRGGAGGYFEGRKNFTQNHAAGVELRASNLTSVADVYDPTQVPGSTGIWLSTVGVSNAASAITVAHTTNDWDVGIGFQVSSVITSSVHDGSSSVTGWKDTGNHTTGIDLSLGTYSGHPIRIPNQKYIAGRNVAGTGFVNMIRVTNADSIELGNAGMNIGTSGSFASPHYDVRSTTAGAAASVDFLDLSTFVFSIIKTAANELVFWSQAAAGNAILIGPGATLTIGFLGHAPAVRQSVGAALSTAGAETNTNLATRINEIRTALINFGLVA